MARKTKTNKDYYQQDLKKKKIGYRKGILASIIVLIPGVLALICFNALLLFSSTNFFLNLLIEEIDPYVWIINAGLITFVGVIGLFLALEVSNFKSFNRKMIKRDKVGFPKENAILQFLTENKGKAFTTDSLVNRINHEGLSEDIESVLSDLVDEKKINRTVKENTLYYSV